MKDTGGPAFPLPSQDVQMIEGRRFDLREEGMSLRDYFAAKVLQGLQANPTDEVMKMGFDEIAEYAYEQADAMLEARKS